MTTSPEPLAVRLTEMAAVRLTSTQIAKLEELKWTWRLSRSLIMREAVAFALAQPAEFRAFIAAREIAEEA